MDTVENTPMNMDKRKKMGLLAVIVIVLLGIAFYVGAVYERNKLSAAGLLRSAPQTKKTTTPKPKPKTDTSTPPADSLAPAPSSDTTTTPPATGTMPSTDTSPAPGTPNTHY